MASQPRDRTSGSGNSHLIEILDSGETDCLRTVSGVVEWILEEGGDEARALLTGGFFDDLTNPNLDDESPNDPRERRRCWCSPHRPACPRLGRLPLRAHWTLGTTTGEPTTGSTATAGRAAPTSITTAT
jgi:hypothetical protein